MKGRFIELKHSFLSGTILHYVKWSFDRIISKSSNTFSVSLYGINKSRTYFSLPLCYERVTSVRILHEEWILQSVESHWNFSTWSHHREKNGNWSREKNSRLELDLETQQHATVILVLNQNKHVNEFSQ